MKDNLIPWFEGLLVDGDEEILMVPLMSLDKTSTASKIHKPFKIARKHLKADYISQAGNIDGIETRVHTRRDVGAGLWYVAVEVCREVS
jgi:hypothetical protein